jgi:hypothetical protein
VTVVVTGRKVNPTYSDIAPDVVAAQGDFSGVRHRLRLVPVFGPVVTLGRARGGRRLTMIGLALLPLLALGLGGCGHPAALPAFPPCHATAGTESFGLDTDQAADAATIAAVAKRLDLPDHAVTIALATALQESKLYNLPYGDLDSLGLFQQRPSQGWGTPSQIMTPRYAAAAFFQHLEKVAGWQDLPIDQAAQAVQHSADADAYTQWDEEARVLAQALTGELPAAFSCQIPTKPVSPTPTAVYAADLSADLGPPTLSAPLAATRGWQVAGWLIGHAAQYGVTMVTVNGQRWTARTGKWTGRTPVSNVVQVSQ